MPLSIKQRILIVINHVDSNNDLMEQFILRHAAHVNVYTCISICTASTCYHFPIGYPESGILEIHESRNVLLFDVFCDIG